MSNLLSRFVKDESGATAIEYGLIAALIAVVIIGVLTTIGTNLQNVFGEVRDGLSTTTNTGGAGAGG
ncbi:Flp family type IVb pilin [Chelatococcus sp. GCM10030263]|uniref:Flp family type IVb pilin n=1 Tax=Chelatococcus sp. GCM10030263 TaxID=3273387 RepID=UPI00361A798F